MTTRTELKEMQCGTCGVWHAIPQTMYDTCVEEGGFWCCPNGHSRGYREGRREREAVRHERDRLKQEAAYYEDRIREERAIREKAERQATAYKGHLTRTKKRIAGGTCPCCKRHFTNLERHMHTKHPEFADSEPDDTVVEFKSA